MIFKKYLSKEIVFEKITYSTPLSAEIIIKNIKANTQKERPPVTFFSRPTKIFLGSIKDKRFEISRIYLKENWNPIIKGLIKENNNETIIECKFIVPLHAKWATIIFITIFILSVITGVWYYIQYSIIEGIFLSLVPLFFLVGISMLEYSTETPITKNELVKLFEKEI